VRLAGESALSVATVPVTNQRFLVPKGSDDKFFAEKHIRMDLASVCSRWGVTPSAQQVGLKVCNWQTIRASLKWILNLAGAGAALQV
jgi:hypothetical protein